MKQLSSITGMVRCVMLLGVASLILLQACHSPISQSVVLSCGPGGPTEGGPGLPCGETNVAVGSAAPSNSVVVDNANVPTGESLADIPGIETCSWTGGQNTKCTQPGQPNCSFYPNRTCKTTWNKVTKRCDCACL
jgi:hypothetical protein